MWDWLAKIEQLRKTDESCILISITQTSGSAPRSAGAKMIVLGGGKTFGTIGGGALELQVIGDALECLKQNKCQSFRYPLNALKQCCGGMVELFMEPLNNRPHVHIFGAGHVGISLCNTLHGTAFNVSIIDDYPDRIKNADVPQEITLVESGWIEHLKLVNWKSSQSYAIVMTPSHEFDLQIVSALICQDANWIGMIGSKHKWIEFRKTLLAQNLAVDKIDRVRCPIGDKKIGRSPREIAIGVAAEILRIVNNDQSES
jgi:xanthine dehydrogenase accessory factor